MQSSVSQARYTRLLESGRKMLDCARTGDWDTVSHMQLKHHQLAEELFKEAVPAAEVPIAAATIREVLKINEEITELGTTARKSCQKDMSSLQQSHQAAKAYAANIV